MSSRHDMYRNVHKGLRRTLCGLVADAGSADTTEAGQRAVAAAWHATSKLLAAHHHHEDTFIGPHLRRLAPSLLAEMEQEHEALAEATRVLDAEAHALTTCAPDALPARALAFYRLLARFVGRYLSHMAEEDGSYLSALQAAYDDAQLAAIEGALLASIAPETMSAFLSLMLPAMNLAERVELLSGMRDHAPPHVFAGTCQLAREVLDAPAFRALQLQLSLVQEASAHA